MSTSNYNNSYHNNNELLEYEEVMEVDQSISNISTLTNSSSPNKNKNKNKSIDELLIDLKEIHIQNTKKLKRILKENVFMFNIDGSSHFVNTELVYANLFPEDKEIKIKK
uniref:Uncharacterized protein n=1 Tax=Heterorhabditis bacteriophora TaxID=37862 RepID=A0A1I7WTT1_HETBA